MVIEVVPSELADLLKTESGASASLAQVRLRKLMVTAQLAFCVWLLIAAGLFARSLALVRAGDLGFHQVISGFGCEGQRFFGHLNLPDRGSTPHHYILAQTLPYSARERLFRPAPLRRL